MRVLTSYLIALYLLLPVTAISQAGQTLQLDTLELHLAAPCYGVGFYQDEIIFLKPGEAIIYRTPQSQLDQAAAHTLFLNKEFTGSPTGFSFSGDYSRGYYTRSLEQDEYRSVEKIFEMSLMGQKVADFSQLSFTADSYRYKDPALSSNDSLMVFSSDRLPTSGGLDLFVILNTPNGWSEPTSIGKQINTSGHECFPFLDSRNNLWFSSTGHPGYGGYDIFVSAFNGQDWDAPRNLGTWINGPGDELGMSIHPLKELALFSRTFPSESRGMAFMLSLIEDAPAGSISLSMQDLADPTEEADSRPQPEPIAMPDPDRLNFRVQILSSEKAKSTPTVSIDGKNHHTYEYFYKGLYRITVGQFETLGEANTFRLQSKKAGFQQAFVAAFRGNKRETDPSVFK